MKKHVGTIFLSIVLLGLVMAASGWAQENQLYVVRASDNSLWKRMCLGDTCTAWSNFPGVLATTPVVVWDDVMQKWWLTGTAPDGSLWRSSFSSNGNFDNNWANWTGAGISVSGAGSKLMPKVQTISNSSFTSIGITCTNHAGSQIVFSKASGTAPSYTIVVEADVILRFGHTEGTPDFARIEIATSPSSCQGSGIEAWVYVPSTIGSSTDIYETVHITRVFTNITSTTTFYLNGIMWVGGSAMDGFNYAYMKLTAYPN